MFGEILTSSEVEFCDQIRRDLAGVNWAQPLLSNVPTRDKLSRAAKPFLFELRFAHEIHRRGLGARYEAPCGVGASTVDFEVASNGLRWRIELVCIGTSEAVRRASFDDGTFFGAQLSSDADDETQTVEGEMILVQQKIGEKVWRDGGPTKFPRPTPGVLHVTLVDMRGFGLDGGDGWDYREVAYGNAGAPPHAPPAHRWPPVSGDPILGLFDKRNTKSRGAVAVRERLHFIGFTNDERYEAGSLGDSAIYIGNPWLLDGDAAAEELMRQFPLRPHRR